MKKLINIYSVLSVLLIVFLSACEGENSTLDQPETDQLDMYISGIDADNLKTNFKNYYDQLNYSNITEVQLDERSTLIKIPSVVSNKEISVLNIIKSDDHSSKAYFEIRKFSNSFDNAEVDVYSLDGILQLTVSADKMKESGLYRLDFDKATTSSRSQGCISNCYQLATTACDSDADCGLLCDLLDIGGLCTASIALACAAHCW